jgi:hypothetical protein
MKFVNLSLFGADLDLFLLYLLAIPTNLHNGGQEHLPIPDGGLIEILQAGLAVNLNLIDHFTATHATLLLLLQACHDALSVVDVAALQFQGWSFLKANAADIF